MQAGVVFTGVNTGGDGQEDGRLTAREVLSLDLTADVVVLSACETGRGTLAGGEGIYGLKRAFMVSGARQLVVSLWKVNDAATAELMRNFYRQLASGKPAAEALQHAKLDMLAGPFAHPYYWAAFVLVGRG